MRLVKLHPVARGAVEKSGARVARPRSLLRPARICLGPRSKNYSRRYEAHSTAATNSRICVSPSLSFATEEVQWWRHDCSCFPAFRGPRNNLGYPVAAFPSAADTANTTIAAAAAAATVSSTALPRPVFAVAIGAELSEDPRFVWFSASAGEWGQAASKLDERPACLGAAAAENGHSGGANGDKRWQGSEDGRQVGPRDNEVYAATLKICLGCARSQSHWPGRGERPAACEGGRVGGEGVACSEANQQSDAAAGELAVCEQGRRPDYFWCVTKPVVVSWLSLCLPSRGLHHETQSKVAFTTSTQIYISHTTIVGTHERKDAVAERELPLLGCCKTILACPVP